MDVDRALTKKMLKHRLKGQRILLPPLCSCSELNATLRASFSVADDKASGHGRATLWFKGELPPPLLAAKPLAVPKMGPGGEAIMIYFVLLITSGQAHTYGPDTHMYQKHTFVMEK